MRLARRGLTTFGEADGMIDARTQAISETTDGRLYTISAIGNRYVNIFDGERFRSVRTYLPPSIEYPGWGWGQITFQDREGEWWIATGSGVVRFPRLASPLELAAAKPKAVYGEREGLALRDVFRLYEDRAGDIWISALGQTSNCLYRWERATDRLHGCGELEGMPEEAVTAFAEDSGGTLWSDSTSTDSASCATGAFTGSRRPRAGSRTSSIRCSSIRGGACGPPRPGTAS